MPRSSVRPSVALTVTYRTVPRRPVALMVGYLLAEVLSFFLFPNEPIVRFLFSELVLAPIMLTLCAVFRLRDFSAYYTERSARSAATPAAVAVPADSTISLTAAEEAAAATAAAVPEEEAVGTFALADMGRYARQSARYVGAVLLPEADGGCDADGAVRSAFKRPVVLAMPAFEVAAHAHRGRTSTSDNDENDDDDDDDDGGGLGWRVQRRGRRRAADSDSFLDDAWELAYALQLAHLPDPPTAPTGSVSPRPSRVWHVEPAAGTRRTAPLTTPPSPRHRPPPEPPGPERADPGINPEERRAQRLGGVGSSSRGRPDESSLAMTWVTGASLAHTHGTENTYYILGRIFAPMSPI
jgi:hypothetical protein